GGGCGLRSQSRTAISERERVCRNRSRIGVARGGGIGHDGERCRARARSYGDSRCRGGVCDRPRLELVGAAIVIAADASAGIWGGGVVDAGIACDVEVGLVAG